MTQRTAGQRHPLLAPLPGFEQMGICASAGTPVSVVGLPPSARALALISLALIDDSPPIAVVTRSDAEAESLVRDLRELARLTRVFDAEKISILPALDADPYDGLTAHLGAVCERVRVLGRLTRGTTRITVIPARALLIPLPPAARLAPFFITVKQDGRFRQADDHAWFLAGGYRRVDLVTEQGEYSRRGGILDIFPPILDQPVRIELEGDTVVSLRHFNPGDQRSTGRAESATLSPARETVLGPPEMQNLIAVLREEGRGAPARRLIELLETQGGFPGIEACARIIYPGAAGILDYIATASLLPPLIVCDEMEMTLEELRQQRAELLEAAAAAGTDTLPPPDRLLMPPGEVEAALRSAPVRTRHLAIDDEEPAGNTPRTLVRIQAASLHSYRGRLADLMEFIRAERVGGRTVCVLLQTEGRVARMKSLLADAELTGEEMDGPLEDRDDGGLYLGVAGITGGFTLPEAGLTVISEHEIFGPEVRHRKRSVLPTFTSDFRDLNPGDMIVHVDHGVGRYEGLTRVGSDGGEIDVMVLSYHGRDRLFVPVTRLDLVQKYSGAGGRAPVLDKLGGTGWVKTKQRVKKAMQDMAAELLNLYAARKSVEGYAYAPDTDWQREFESAFPYELTIDQQIALNEIKRDLEGHTPMDRLLCGDVGFGKTEVALRAAFKTVMEGKQVAVLAPTTILVFQHQTTFRERFAAFPSRIESLSRFRSPKEQKSVVAGLATGTVDVVIGTHRLLSADVEFKDLGLLIVDEEQRFGVAHKEKLKKLKRNVDVLTLTATPIPRTLQMSLMGVRDLSVIETPPENRLAIQTHLLPFKEPIIQSAIRHELARDGQVYFVHNRVDSVYAMAALLKKLVPESEIGVAHGQMPEKELEEAMMKFLRGEFNVLVSTSIIENGLDIPRVNTMIVNRADHFGLSQLYQLRGRIGRSDRQAYAYLLVPPEGTLNEDARKRLRALQEFSALGSGFRIAAMDLEIRGAGNMLGGEQHGHIAALGFELYCRMLERAVLELKEGAGEIVEFRATINLAVDLKIPQEYIADEHHRLMFYKRIASATEREDLDKIRDEMVDRYGKLPRQGLNLVEVAGLRILADRLKVAQFDYRAGSLTVKFDEGSSVDPEMILRFVKRRSDATFSPPAVLKIKGDRPEAERLAIAREVLTALA